MTHSHILCYSLTIVISLTVFQAPLICPIFVLLVSIYFVLAPIIAAPDWGYIYALLLLVFSLVIYVPLVKYKKVVPGTGRLHR